MNYRMIFRMLGIILLTLAAILLLPLAVGLYYRENVTNFIITIGISALAGLLLYLIKPDSTDVYAPEGFAIVALGWLLMSLVGALPFYISGDIPSYMDAFFETVSGLSTTGATILNDVESLSRSCMFWRLFTHWLGGMGVLVFIMAVMPLSGDHSMHLMRAEVPGPIVSKLVPRARKSALILYGIYVVLTLLEAGFLMGGGMSFYDAILHACATAGTGGFSTRQAGIAAFNSLYIEMVVAVFMILFSINFNLYFLIIMGHAKDALKSEELHVFLIILISAIGLIALTIRSMYSGMGEALRHAFFNVATIVSTTGFGTVDFNLWPEFAKWILLVLMLIGGCAGSTAGGLKLSRVMILVKAAFADLRQTVHPRSVNIVRLEGQRVSTETVKVTLSYFVLYFLTLLLSAILISFDGMGTTTSLTASLACISNIGPGLDKVGPAGNYAAFSDFSKLIMSVEMLMGRLEIYPVLMLFYPKMWRLRNRRAR